MSDVYYLYKSDRPDKKYVMIMPSHKHLHRFGSSLHRDFTLMNNKSSKFYEPDPAKREQVKENYHKRHSKEKGGRHTASSMSKIILWSSKSLRGGIRNYEDKFGVRVIFKDKKLTDLEKDKLMKI